MRGTLPRIVAHLFGGVSLLAVLAGCGAAAAPKPDPGTLVEVDRADGATMNPLYAQSQQDAILYVTLLFDGLTAIGPGFVPVPALATAWSHSPDGLTWQVDLRRDTGRTLGQVMRSLPKPAEPA